MKLHGKTAIHGRNHPAFRHIILLSICCALGILVGCLAARSVSDRAVSQLASYLNAYTQLRCAKADLSSFVFAVAVYFRYILLLFLFSFSAIGAYCVPLICAVQGFGLAYAFMLFVQSVGGNLLAVASLFVLRCLFILPTMLYCGSAAIVSSGRGRESHGKEFWRQFGLCACVLFIGAILETFVVPSLFAAAYAA